jgi:hypothetical protein
VQLFKANENQKQFVSDFFFLKIEMESSLLRHFTKSMIQYFRKQ